MNILDNDGVNDKVLSFIKNEDDLTLFNGNIEQNKLRGYIEDNNIEVLLVRSATKVDKDVLDSNCLKHVIRAGVGLDNVDLDYANEKGITVNNTPNSSSNAVAELTFALLLNIARNVSCGVGPTEESFKSLKKQKGFELMGKTIGIIGYGRIGKRVGEIAKALGMGCIIYDKFIEEYSDSLDILLKDSDIISLHCPYNGEYIISTEEIEKMKNGVVLLNVGRGGLLDEIAVLDNISKFSGVGLDTFENEPKVYSYMKVMNKYVCTPHIGSQTLECQENIALELIDIIKNLK